MQKFIFSKMPVWLFLLCLLASASFTVLFGWAIQSTLSGNDRSGIFGKAAISIAKFPSMVKLVVTEFKTEADTFTRVPRFSNSISDFSEIKQKSDMGVTGLEIRADMRAITHAVGWRILVGTFVINGDVENAAIALSPELEIKKIWLLSERKIEDKEPRPAYRKFIHGFDIMKDGSVVFSFDGGISLQRFDYCGSRIWATGGDFHHAVSLDDQEETVWSLRGKSVVQVSTETGSVIKGFSMDDVIAANPTINILDIHKRHPNDLGGNSRNTSGKWERDPFHLNDVDPLPFELIDRYEEFSKGDLLVSARSLNLIFVIDPSTLLVKWWRIGATNHQHDPDWGRNGEITVFDNRMGSDFSRIISIEPNSYHTKILFDGSNNDFYSRIRGKHQITGSGNIIVASSQQGRIFEVDQNGETILEIVNKKPEDDEFNYTVSQAIWLPADAFDFAENIVCPN